MLAPPAPAPTSNKQEDINDNTVEQPQEIPTQKIKEYKLLFPEPTGIITTKIDDATFTFLKADQSVMGTLTVKNIVDYVSNISLDPNEQKLLDLIMFTQKKLNTASPFLNNLDILFILNRQIKNFPEVKQFAYSLLEHTLNTIAIASHQMKDISEEVKQKLMRYSIGIMYQMTQYLSTSLSTYETKYTELNTSIEEIKKTNNTIEQKINALMQTKH